MANAYFITARRIGRQRILNAPTQAANSTEISNSMMTDSVATNSTKTKFRDDKFQEDKYHDEKYIYTN